jgi:hypothetical protein
MKMTITKRLLTCVTVRLLLGRSPTGEPGEIVIWPPGITTYVVCFLTFRQFFSGILWCPVLFCRASCSILNCIDYVTNQDTTGRW